MGVIKNYIISLRKIYLEDFKNKILNYKTGLKTFLLNLKISYDKDFNRIRTTK